MTEGTLSMTPSHTRLFGLPGLILILVLAACADGEVFPRDGGTLADLATADRGRPDAAAPDRGTAKPDLGGPVSSCSAIGSSECFGNVDCAAGQRCENVGTPSSPVPCCVSGARGTGQAGASCTGELDCQSGVCIAKSGPYRCSRTCQSAADCPAGMKDCKFIAFSGSSHRWCFPEK